MKKHFFLILKVFILGIFILSTAAIIAQTDSTSVSSSDSTPSFFVVIKETFFGILLLGGPLFMIGHMIYVLIDTKNLKKTVSVEDFRNKRRKKGLDENSSNEENEQASNFLEDAWLLYSEVVDNGDGTETRSPAKMREVLKAKSFVNKAGSFLPTDPDIVDRYNKHRQFLYDNLNRSFFSSWKLIILCIVVAFVTGFMGTGGDSYWITVLKLGSFFWVPAIIYYMSGFVPQYMINRKIDRGGGGGWFVTLLVGLGLGVLGSGYTVRTKYTDGSHSDDHSGHWIALFLGIIVLFAVALTIYIWAIINYLRNYVLYI